MNETYTRVGDQWYRGCGCGRKPSDLITLPQGTVRLFFQRPGVVTGPVTGQKYNIQPNTIALDIRAEDEAGFRAQGLAFDPTVNFKGAFTQVGT